MKNSKSTIDSNTRLSFQKTYVTEIGPSSYHKLADLNIVQSSFQWEKIKNDILSELQKFQRRKLSQGLKGERF